MSESGATLEGSMLRAEEGAPVHTIEPITRCFEVVKELKGACFTRLLGARTRQGGAYKSSAASTWPGDLVRFMIQA